MGTVLTLVILTAYLAVTQFLGLLLYKRFERWVSRVKERRSSPKPKSKPTPETKINEELEKEVAWLKKQLESKDPVMESI